MLLFVCMFNAVREEHAKNLELRTHTQYVLERKLNNEI